MTQLAPDALAAIDQIAADAGVPLDAAVKLVSVGAERTLDLVIAALETECRATCDTTLRGERRLGGHLMIGEMVGRLKILRRMTREG